MLSSFPELLYLAPFSAFFIRIAVAIILAKLALEAVRMEGIWTRASGLITGLAALFLFVGAFTQPMALIGLISIAESLMRSTGALPKSSLWLALVMTASLLVTGAGPFAFDLPL